MNSFGKLLVKLGATPPPDDDFWYNPTNVPWGSYLSAFDASDTALRIGTVKACVRLRSETIASLPCQVFRRTEQGREVDYNHPLYYLLHQSPNDDMSAFEFWQTVEQNLCTDGNHYSQIFLNGRDEVSKLVPLDPEQMQVQRDKETGLKVFVYGPDRRTFLADEILHIPGLGYDGAKRMKGMNPLSYMRSTLQLTDSAENYAVKYFQNDAAPKAYISHPQRLTSETKDKILKWMMERFGGVKNAGKLGILEEGMKIETLPISHADMQFLELRKFQNTDIARAYGVPPHKIGELDRSTNNNIEHQGIEWVTDTIRPECTRIEKRCNLQLLGPRESSQRYIEFNLNALMRGDSAARAAYYSSLRNIGAMNANEIRRAENLNDYEGGEVYMVQGAMIPVAMAGQQQQQKAVAQ